MDFFAYSDKAAVPGLNRNHLHQAPVRIPVDVGEQRGIAELLGTFDDRIEVNRAYIRTLDAMVRAIFKSWFVDLEPTLAKDVRQKSDCDEAPLRLLRPSDCQASPASIPQGWRHGSILEIATLLSGGTPRTEESRYWGGDIPWASAKDVSQAREPVLLDTERRITAAGLAESTTQLIPTFSAVVVARGATTGRMVLLGTEMAMNQTCYALHTTTSTPLALYYLVRNAMERLVHSAHGSVFDTITTSTFRTSSVLIPPIELLRAFDELTQPFIDRIVIAVTHSSTLAAMRDALQPRLLSGELRLHKSQSIHIL
jgi:type I restriction enzyme, S subunit